MSTIAPPAPPPPALTTTNRINCSTTRNNKLDECIWAANEHSELQIACYLARVCAFSPPRKCAYYNVGHILQDGPTCGITAVSMLMDGRPEPRELLAKAKEKQYTNLGEMFSANNLYQLICDELDMPTKECELYQGRLNCAKVKASLLDGACIFVPYDPDYNHAPCLKRGHKAHWALVIGYLIDDKDEFFVIARHGKAKNLSVWSLADLSESNANLIEFAQPKGYPDCDFLLPPGGIAGDKGLRERAIIVNNWKQHVILTVR